MWTLATPIPLTLLRDWTPVKQRAEYDGLPVRRIILATEATDWKSVVLLACCEVHPRITSLATCFPQFLVPPLATLAPTFARGTEKLARRTGRERVRAAQIRKWLFDSRCRTFDEMTDLGKGLRVRNWPPSSRSGR